MRSSPSAGRLGYVPALDGLRGLSVIGVIVHHLNLRWFYLGFLGVDVFFVLSGFLITSLLAQEWQANGSINIPQFYRRRLLRLLPALITLILITVPAISLFGTAQDKYELWDGVWGSLLYVSNWVYMTHGLGTLGITWSLGIEDQFYIVWALSLPLLLRYLPRSAIVAVLIVLGCISAFLCAFLWLQTGNYNRVYAGSDTRSVGLIIGSLAGLLFAWGKVPPSRLSATVLRTMLAVGCLYILYLQFFAPGPFPALFFGGFTIVALAAISVVLLAVASPYAPRSLMAVLTWKPLVRVGVISYGLYLWHTFFVWLFSPAHILIDPFWYTWFIVPLATLLVAAVSYRYIERPFLRLKHRRSLIGDELANNGQVSTVGNAAIDNRPLITDK